MANDRPEPGAARQRSQGSSAAPDAGPDTPELPHSDPKKRGFVPATLDRTVIAVPLLEEIRAERAADKQRTPFKVVIDLNLEYRAGRSEARKRALQLIDEAIAQTQGKSQDANAIGINERKSELSTQYLFATLYGETISELVRLDNEPDQSLPPGATSKRTAHRSIHRIWPDFPVRRLTTKSISTVKADAARVAFSALGEGIVWAVVDSGISETHPHFAKHGNLALDPPFEHCDLTGSAGGPLSDALGHGTHVAGIIAGEMSSADEVERCRALTRYRDENGEVTHDVIKPGPISGMAPCCKLLSLKVLDEKGEGETSSLIAALEIIQRLNDYGRRLRVHGVNMSVGYAFEPEWFACGRSPLCVEVDRLVRTGVVVVVAAGNTGYGWAQTAFQGEMPSGMSLTINDPGNAAHAITVGSTHRESPHVYGVSYFSSKGPTGDGRLKPDLVAPGEKILSCAAGVKHDEVVEQLGGAVPETAALYAEDSGTSMAAPHVAGVIAAFLSIRREFIGRPEDVKDIFLAAATDLKRERSFQGHGLVDLMRAIQSV
jgi:serine protease AprX